MRQSEAYREMEAKLGNESAGGNYAGMTLRDWFAGQALTGILVGLRAGGFAEPNEYQANRLAVNVYFVADAMLEARKK